MTKVSPSIFADVPTVLPQPKELSRYVGRHALPAVWMRSGTSKGLFLHRKDLPQSPSSWDQILLSAMGSVKGSTSQIDGMGGGTSTTSKVAVVARSTRPGVDVEYTFVQVAPDQAKVDMTGNCGNMLAGVGPFALDEGIVETVPGDTEMDIRIFNTNTEQTIIETVQVTPDGRFREDGDYSLPGVQGTSSPIKTAFLNPAGSMTGRLFPTGAKQETLTVQSRYAGSFTVRASLIDAANPFVLVDASSLPSVLQKLWPDKDNNVFLSTIEDIRRQGAVQMGLAKDLDAAGLVRGTPKIALLTSAADDESDISLLSFSMGKPHPSLQLTGAVCIGAAMSIHGTVAWDLANDGQKDGTPRHGMAIEGHQIAAPIPWRIRHPAGVIKAETVLGMGKNGAVHVDRVAVYRTARRLFEGNVFYRA